MARMVGDLGPSGARQSRCGLRGFLQEPSQARADPQARVWQPGRGPCRAMMPSAALNGRGWALKKFRPCPAPKTVSPALANPRCPGVDFNQTAPVQALGSKSKYGGYQISMRRPKAS